ncbi:hypothetical protein BJEO58_00388 [Brevibacterium jeotgali]|uniref:Uncharacterized protein n=1 Tax=Brevibacterium jeotgali TaxID=1262550 RepID=A0A2H1L319_9MICO|nr:hypothetical protein FB108_1492 [Brevibacterium jeotgali]SMY10813.1 hypothetical protein BJEO58_00388 [Brevibacterium jeotgali]
MSLSTSEARRVSSSPSPPPLPDELVELLKRMRMPYLRAIAADVLATAKAQRWDPAEVLRVLLAEEARGRDEATKAGADPRVVDTLSLAHTGPENASHHHADEHVLR